MFRSLKFWCWDAVPIYFMAACLFVKAFACWTAATLLGIPIMFLNILQARSFWNWLGEVLAQAGVPAG